MRRLIIANYGSLSSRAGRFDFARWWQDRESLASGLGLDVTHVSGTFARKPERLITHNVYRLPRCRKAFNREIESDNVVLLGLDSLLSEPEGQMAFDWDFTAYYGRDLACDVLSVTGMRVDAVKSKGRGFARAILDRILDNDQKRVRIAYGFSAIMDRKFAPSGYAMGLGSYGAPDCFSYDANAWDQFAGKQCGHRLRNVFGFNLLNRNHLKIKVEDECLKDWIEASSRRGRLEPLNERLFLWTFSRDENDMDFLAWDYPPVVKVRRELEKHRLFPWQELA